MVLFLCAILFPSVRQSMMTPSPALPPSDPADRILALDMLSGGDTGLPPGLVTTARFAELDEALLARARPDLVMLPLLTPGHDATAVVARLQELGFAGRIVVVAVRLPNARMVEAELRSLGPGKRLSLLMPPHPDTPA